MRVTKKLRLPLRRSLVDSGVSGEILAHAGKANMSSMGQLMKRDSYVTFGIAEVDNALRRGALTKANTLEIMASSLGITVERYRQHGPSYIDPEATAAGLDKMFDAIDEAIKSKALIILATAHPGSLLSFYHKLVEYIRGKGGWVYETPEPYQVEQYRWFDAVGAVHMLTDQGSLMHTHDSNAFWKFLAQLPEAPGLVIADHGYAGAAINRDLKTASIHDVDDPGIPMAAYLMLDVIPIPMNDNQLNLPTMKVVDAMVKDRLTR